MARIAQHVKAISRHIGAWMDCHPRTGWYVVGLLLLNTLLNLMDLFVK